MGFQIVKLTDPPVSISTNVNPKGAYSNSTTYSVGDVVTYNGLSYIARQSTTGNLPTDTTYWQLVYDDQTKFTTCRNATGATIYKGTIVYLSGATGTNPNIVKAQADSDAHSARTFGVAFEDIANNADGKVLSSGIIDTLDTRSTATNPFTSDTLAAGDVVYLSPTTAGYITKTKPSAPSHLVYVGFVANASPTSGKIIYRIQNGYELDELHDVSITSVANNNSLFYDSTSGLWKNRAVAATDIDANVSNTEFGYLDGVTSSIQTQIDSKQASLGYTAENVANKDTTTTLGTSDTKYPSQKAVKTYVDTGLGTKQDTITGAATSITSSNLTASKVLVSDASGKVAANAVSSTTLGYLDATSSIQTQLNSKQASLGYTAEDSANKDTDGTLAANSDTKYASQKATKTYADTKLAKSSNLSDVSNAATSFSNIKQNASTSATGVVQLAGDLSGTATSPTVPGLIPSQISTLTTIGHSWTASIDQSYKQANFGYTGIIARLLGILGIHENNHTHLGVGASYLCRTSTAFGTTNSGWGGLFQFVMPFSDPLQADINALNDFTNPIPQPSSFLIVHGINDIAVMSTNFTATGFSFISAAYQATLRTYLSRIRAATMFASYYNSSGSVVWDSAITTSGFTSTGQTTINTGVAVYRSTTNTNTLTFTIPSNFTGGTIALCFLANSQCQAKSSTAMNATDVSTTITVNNASSFANNDIVQMYSGGVASGELMKITAGGGTTSLTLSRGFNGTTKTTHASGDEIYKRNDAQITFSGTASSASGTLDVGSIALPSQSLGSHKIPVVKRFTLTAADAGKTIISTVGNIMTGASNTQVDFDSAWIESAVPQPTVVTNLPIYGLAGDYSVPTMAQYMTFNDGIDTIVGEFDSMVKVADIKTPTWKQSGTLNASITNAGGINFTITANDPTTFATYGANQTFCIEGERIKVASITNNNDGTFTLNNITRAQQGTTAASHASGKTISAAVWFSPDGVHPNSFGAAALAESVHTALENITATSPYSLSFAGGSSSLDMRANNLGLQNLSYLTLPTNVQTNATGTLNTVYAHPIYIPQVCIVQEMGCIVTTLNASSVLRFGIFGLDATRSQPLYLIKDFGTVGGTATGFRSVTANHLLRPGWYFLGMKDEGTAASTKRCIGASGLNLPYLATMSAPGTAYAPINSFSAPGGTAGAFPTDILGKIYFTAQGALSEETTAKCPIMFIRVRSKHMS